VGYVTNTQPRRVRSRAATLAAPVPHGDNTDRDGHIMHLFNARLPKRPQGDFVYWQGVVSGDTSATLWTEYHPYDDLPRVVDPASGWLHNSNEPPWTTTFPYALDPEDHPPYTTLPPMTTIW
jgi:acyl-homoserine lactone acylase PvdQ